MSMMVTITMLVIVIPTIKEPKGCNKSRKEISNIGSTNN